MNADIKLFIDTKDRCFSSLAKKYGAKAALRKLMAMTKDQAMQYGNDFYDDFIMYRKLHKSIIRETFRNWRR